MIRTPHHPNLMLQRKTRSKLSFIQRYQHRHAMFLLKFGLVFGLFLAGVVLFLLNSNYFMFKNILLIYSPHVIKALNIELRLANEIIFAAVVVYTVFMWWLGLKLSQKLVTPIMVIQEKVRGLCRGNLYDAKIKIRKSDEFQDFCDSYNYLVETLRAQVEVDLERLKTLKPDPKNKDATYIWEQMVEEKLNQLGKDKSSDPSVQPEPTVSVRPAS